jgi:hypothetical protein
VVSIDALLTSTISRPTSESCNAGTEKWEALKAWSLSRQVLTAGGAAFCYWYAYTGLVAAAKLQTSTSTYVDLLGLTMVTQLASVFWDGAWLLLLLVRACGCRMLYVSMLTGSRYPLVLHKNAPSLSHHSFPPRHRSCLIEFFKQVPIIGLSSWLLPIIGMFRGAGGGGADEAGDSAGEPLTRVCRPG